MTPSVHFLVRQAARERLSATRTLSEEAKARHNAMAELYMHRAQQLRGYGEKDNSPDDENPMLAKEVLKVKPRG